MSVTYINEFMTSFRMKKSRIIEKTRVQESGFFLLRTRLKSEKKFIKTGFDQNS